MAGLNTLDADSLFRMMAQQSERLRKLENMLQGVPISTVKIADAAITNAKIANAAIDDAKIVTLSWGKAQGGTAKLGGDANGNGILEVYDAAGNLKGVWDKDGLTIYDGQLVIQNEDGNTTLDGLGIVSAQNFGSGSYDATNLINTTNASANDISGATLTFTLPRSTRILVSLSAVTDYFPGAAGNGTNIGGKVFLNVDGSNVNELRSLFYPDTGLDFEVQDVISFTKIVTLGSGSHTIKLQWATDNSGEQFSLTDRSLTYVLLGN